MKIIIFLSALLLCLGGTVLKAQSSTYSAAMKANFKSLQEAKTIQDYNSVSAAFSRIAKAENNLWVPYYYAALAKINGAMNDEAADKDQVGLEVDSLLASAERLEKNSELSTLHYYNEILKMSVNPAQRFMQAAPLLERYYQTAIREDSTNPRIYYLKAQTVLHTPERFGGGKKAAQPLFEKSVKLFDVLTGAKDSTLPFKPFWGEQQAKVMLKKTHE